MYIPDYKLESPVRKPAYRCDRCDAELDGDDALFEYEGRYLCYDCFVNLVLTSGAKDIVDISPALAKELARVLSVDSWTAEELASA